MKLKAFLLCLLLALPALTVQAQGGSLNYGANVVGSLSATAPLAFHTFSGTAGDRVTVVVIGITPGLDPAVSLNSPTQQQLANNDNDPTSAGSTDSRVTITLPQNGVYTILVSSVTGTPGDFLLRLFGQPGAPATDVSATGADTAVSGITQVFSFNGDPTAAQTVNISTTTPGFGFRVGVFDPAGQTLGLLNGGDMAGVSMTVPPSAGVYTVEVAPVDPNVQGQVLVNIGTPVQQESTEDVPPPVATEETVPASDVCAASPAAGSVNIRSGPSTDFNAFASLNPGDSLAITGAYNGWYRVDVPGLGAGWVFSGVVSISGPCGTIPTLTGADVPAMPAPAATPVPQQGGQPTPTATTPQTQQEQPTATQPAEQGSQPTPTFTPSYTPTTPPAAQIAPPDARFNNPLILQLDSTGSVTDFVSYPDGDTEDRVRWDINGMNQSPSLSGGRARLTLAVSCFGQNTDQVQFFTNGHTYTCGQTIFDQEVTFDSKTGQVTITAVGGQGTYIQWVLTGTAVRVN